MATTDLARIDTQATAALDGASQALTRLGQWVTAAQHAHQLVDPLVDTPFVPDAYRPKVDPRATEKEKADARQVAVANATAAVLQGITLGLDPLTALQQIYLVHGRPGMYARAKVALVKAAGHEIWTEDLSDTRAVVCGRRVGTTEVERVIITMDQAKKAGWTKNSNYQTTPQDMLYARAAGRVADRIAPERLLGIASVEEIQDTITASAEVGTGRRTVQPRRRRPQAAQAALPAGPAAEEPPLDDDTPAAATAPAAGTAEPDLDPATDTEPEAEAEPGITPAQSKKMHTLLGKTGRGDRDTALVWIAGVIGRPVESTKEMSRAEARMVIDQLEAGQADQPPLDGEQP